MKSTKRSLILSVFSMLLCITMLLGTTYAWFTDTVTSGKNKIIAGNLDVELVHSNASVTDQPVQDATDLFGVELWEPGVVAYENFTVSNVGNLALKYALSLNVFDKNATENGNDLTEVIKVAVVEDGFSGDREDAKALEFTTLATFQKTGSLEAGAADDVFGVVLYWEPTDNDNLYNLKNGLTSTDGEPLFVEFGVTVLATQDTVEEDSFDEFYDEGTAIAAVTNGIAPTVEIDATPDTDSGESTTIEFEEGSFTGDGTLELTLEVKDVPPASHFSVADELGTVASIDISAVFDGVDVSQFNGKTVTITTYIAKGLEPDKLDVVYTGEGEKPDLVSYDALTGKLVFTTTHFSEYLVTESTVTAYDIASKTFYHDLSGAVIAQDSDIILLKDVKLVAKGITFNAGTTSTLDLNGYALNGVEGASGNSALIANNGTLTVADNTDAGKNGTGTGVLSNEVDDPDTAPVPGYACNCITNKGTLTVESGLIYNRTNTGGAVFAIDNMNKATLIVNGGKMLVESSNAIRQYDQSNSKDNHVTVNGGIIESKSSSAFWLQDGNNTGGAGSLTINGGTFKGPRDAIQIGYDGSSKDFDISIGNCDILGNLKFVFTDYKSVNVDLASINLTGAYIQGCIDPYVAPDGVDGIKTGYITSAYVGMTYSYDFGVDLTGLSIMIRIDGSSSKKIDPSYIHVDGSVMTIDGEALVGSVEGWMWIDIYHAN